MPAPSSTDLRIRQRTFGWLQEQTAGAGEILPRPLLAAGFLFEGQRVRLVGPQGIFKPECMDLPLSITTVPDGPYDDGFGADGRLRYHYRGTDDPVPEPLASRRYSGRFLVRVPPDVYRRLAVEAGEAGVSLNRIASDRLSR